MRRLCPRAQRGVIALMAVLFLLFMLSVVLMLAHQMSATDVYDSGAQNNSVEALFLAESGVERATWRFKNGIACGALGEAAILHGRGQFIIGNGLGTDFNGVALAANRCRVPVTGEITGAIRVSRRAEAIVENGSSAIVANDVSSGSSNTGTSLTFPHVVAAGDTVLLVGVSVDRNDTTVSVTYNTQPLTLTAFTNDTGGGGGRPKAQIWSLVNPPVGTFNVIVTLNTSEQVIAGAVSFAGVNTTTSFDVAATTNVGNGTIATVPITPATNNAWVFEVVAVDNNPALAMTAQANRIGPRWNLTVSSNVVRGAASTIGPINPAALVTPRWTWVGNRRWAQAAVALRPGGPSRVVAWRELTN